MSSEAVVSVFCTYGDFCGYTGDKNHAPESQPIPFDPSVEIHVTPVILMIFAPEFVWVFHFEGNSKEAQGNFKIQDSKPKIQEEIIHFVELK